MKTHVLSLLLLSIVGFYAQVTAAQVNNPKTAVLIVGNDAQDHAVDHLNSLATIFQENGVKVYKFYYPNARWSDIKAKAKTCSFFIYTGHGFGNGGLDGEFGGLYVNDFVMAQDIVDGLQFQFKPLIIYLNACGSHGSSQDDPADIGFKEATKRVSDTALPFFMVGAGGYFATSGLITGFIEDFLEGLPLSTCFEDYVDSYEDIFINQSLSTKNTLNSKHLAIAGNTISSKPMERYYGTAYVGPTNFTVQAIDQTTK